MVSTLKKKKCKGERTRPIERGGKNQRKEQEYGDLAPQQSEKENLREHHKLH